MIHNELVEIVARAICRADNVDPEKICVSIGSRAHLPIGSSYPAWEYRIAQAKDAIKKVRIYDAPTPFTEDEIIQTKGWR